MRRCPCLLRRSSRHQAGAPAVGLGTAGRRDRRITRPTPRPGPRRGLHRTDIQPSPLRAYMSGNTCDRFKSYLGRQPPARVHCMHTSSEAGVPGSDESYPNDPRFNLAECINGTADPAISHVNGLKDEFSRISNRFITSSMSTNPLFAK